MKKLHRYLWLIAPLALFASCQSPKQVLSKSDSRTKIMTNIASDHEMSKEMLDAIMQGDHGIMMKDDPEMKKRMMSGMMKTVKADTSMMAGMCKPMMDNPEMMEMMQKMKEKDKGLKMKEMNKNSCHDDVALLVKEDVVVVRNFEQV